MREWILSMAAGAVRSSAMWVFEQIGIGGVIAIVAGLILALALTARAFKLLTSARGMAICTAALLIGLGLLWWSWRSVKEAVASVLPSGGGSSSSREHEASEEESGAEGSRIEALALAPPEPSAVSQVVPAMPAWDVPLGGMFPVYISTGIGGVRVPMPVMLHNGRARLAPPPASASSPRVAVRVSGVAGAVASNPSPPHSASKPPAAAGKAARVQSPPSTSAALAAKPAAKAGAAKGATAKPASGKTAPSTPNLALRGKGTTRPMTRAHQGAPGRTQPRQGAGYLAHQGGMGLVGPGGPSPGAQHQSRQQVAAQARRMQELQFAREAEMFFSNPMMHPFANPGMHPMGGHPGGMHPMGGGVHPGAQHLHGHR